MKLQTEFAPADFSITNHGSTVGTKGWDSIEPVQQDYYLQGRIRQPCLVLVRSDVIWVVAVKL
jgi:hypothetical protein